jgi:hypothetical protein
MTSDVWDRLVPELSIDDRLLGFEGSAGLGVPVPPGNRRPQDRLSAPVRWCSGPGESSTSSRTTLFCLSDNRPKMLG